MIDLEEIWKTNNLIKSRCNDIEKYGKIGVPGKDDVCIRYMQAKQIATALEQLPALVEALKDAVKNYDMPSIIGDDFTKIQPNHWWVKAKQALDTFTDRQPEPEKVKTLENDPTIDTVGNCANCGVEFHIHKTESNG